MFWNDQLDWEAETIAHKKVESSEGREVTEIVRWNSAQIEASNSTENYLLDIY